MVAPLRSRPLKKEALSGLFKREKTTAFSDPPRSAPSKHLVWSPIGTAIATTSGPLIRVWNPEKPNVKASQELRGHIGTVERVCWSPVKESELASTGADGTVKLWDVRIGGGAGGKSSIVHDIKIGDQGLFMTYNPNGTELVVGRRDDVIVPIDVRMGAMGVVEGLEAREGRKIHSAVTNQVCFSNTGREIFATGGDGSVRVLDWPSMEQLHSLNGHTYSAYSVAYSPNGGYLAVGGGDSLISLWDTYDWVCKHTLANSTAGVHSLSFSFDGTFICGASGADKDGQSGIDIAHVEIGEYVHSVETTHIISQVAWHPLRYWLAYTDHLGLKVIGLGGSL